MTPHRLFSIAAIAAAATVALTACSTLPADNPALLAARQAYEAAQSDSQTRTLAPAELAAAAAAINRANEAFTRGDRTSEVDHLAHLAGRQAAVAQQVGRQKAAEQTLSSAEAERDRDRLAARTSEAQAAQSAAAVARSDAQAWQRDAEAAQRTAANARRQTDVAREAAETERTRSDVSQQQALSAEARVWQLQDQLRDLNAQQTERGLVVSIGDMLFDTGRAELRAGSQRSMEKLVSFFKAHPQRKALVEGFTDSVGGDVANQALSSRRAEAVRIALVRMGVSPERIDALGYGAAYPVASNDSASGRQLNRRVEVVLSDDKGRIAAR